MRIIDLMSTVSERGKSQSNETTLLERSESRQYSEHRCYFFLTDASWPVRVIHLIAKDNNTVSTAYFVVSWGIFFRVYVLALIIEMPEMFYFHEPKTSHAGYQWLGTRVVGFTHLKAKAECIIPLWILEAGDTTDYLSHVHRPIAVVVKQIEDAWC